MADLVMQELQAVIDERTTMVCLRAAGQVVPVGEPFDTLMGYLEAPPFHVHCRSVVVPWMPGFVSDARKAANAEIARRPPSEKRFGPGGYGGRLPPPPDTPMGGPVLPPTAPTGPTPAYAPIDVDALDYTAVPSPSGLMIDQGVSDETLRAMMGQTGADGLPSLIGPDDVAGVLNDGGVALYRGVRSSDAISAERMVDEFAHKPLQYVGRGVKGNGFYFAESEKEARSYAGSDGKTMAVVLRGDAKVVDHTQLLRESGSRGRHQPSAAYTEAINRVNQLATEGKDGTPEYQAAIREWRAIGDADKALSEIRMDDGRWALSQGYDAIRFKRDGIEQYVILNRSALYFVEG